MLDRTETGNKINIFHDIHLENAWGGAENHFVTFVRENHKKGLARNYLFADQSRLTTMVKPVVRHLTHPPVKPERSSYWHVFPRSKKSVKQQLIKKWDIDVILSWSRFGSTKGLRLAKKTGARPVYWEHGSAWFEHSRKLSSQFLHGYDLAIANSYAAKAMLLQRWEFCAPIVVSYYGIISSDQDTAPLPRRLPEGRRIRLGFAARLRAFKGGVLAIHALNMVRRLGLDAELWIAGEGPDKQWMQALVNKLALPSDCVKFLGYVDNMDWFYNQIDLLVHPALREPFGLCCAEANALGCPVVTTNVDGLPEAISDGETGYCVKPTLPLSGYASLGGNNNDVYSVVFDPDSGNIMPPKIPEPEMIGRCVADILSNSVTYEAFSKAGIERSYDKFHYDRHMNEVFNSLHSL